MEDEALLMIGVLRAVQARGNTFHYHVMGATNELGRRCAAQRAIDDVYYEGMPEYARSKHCGTTLGAYRKGKQMTWIPGAIIEVWTKCARQDTVTGVQWPHAHFMQVLGSNTSESGSIHCPQCRAELAKKRAASPVSVPPPARGQLSLF